MPDKFLGSQKKYFVDSPEKAYTLGFIWGDGRLTTFKNNGIKSNIHYISLEIVKEDLDKISKLFFVWGNWKFYYRNRVGRKPQGTIILFDKDFGWWLTKHDYLIKSNSEPTKILSKIPNKFKAYWWRGFTDADGCFYQNKKSYLNQFSLVGAHNQSWSETIKLFNKLNIDKYLVQNRIQNKKSKSSSIRLNSLPNIIKFGNFIFKDNLNIGLERKYLKFLDIRNHFFRPSE